MDAFVRCIRICIALLYYGECNLGAKAQFGGNGRGHFGEVVHVASGGYSTAQHFGDR